MLDGKGGGQAGADREIGTTAASAYGRASDKAGAAGSATIHAAFDMMLTATPRPDPPAPREARSGNLPPWCDLGRRELRKPNGERPASVQELSRRATPQRSVLGGTPPLQGRARGRAAVRNALNATPCFAMRQYTSRGSAHPLSRLTGRLPCATGSAAKSSRPRAIGGEASKHQAFHGRIALFEGDAAPQAGALPTRLASFSHDGSSVRALQPLKRTPRLHERGSKPAGAFTSG